MKTCENYNDGKAFEMPNRYSTIIVCEIERGKCPHDQEGNRLICNDNKVRIICNSSGLTKKLGN